MFMLMAALFAIAPNRKQPSCLSRGERLNKQWYIYTKEY